MKAKLQIDEPLLAEVIIRHFPSAQAAYLFGSYAQGEAWPQSDVDLGVLLPAVEARQQGSLALSDCALELADLLQKEVDLINLREVNTILQTEVVDQGRVIFLADELALDYFEMQVIKAFQMLNQERAEIVADGLKTGRFYDH